MSNPKGDEGKLFSWTFILQALTLTFNLSYIVHLSMLSTVEGLENIWNHWELFLITTLSLVTTLKKFEDLYENETHGLRLITVITGMALVASIVADFHFLPALGGALAESNVPSLYFFVVFGVSSVFFIIILFQGRIEPEFLEGVWSKYKLPLLLFLIAIITITIIIIYVLNTGGGKDALKAALLPMTIGALAANIIATVLVIYENILKSYGFGKRKVENLEEKRKEIDKRIEEIQKEIKSKKDDNLTDYMEQLESERTFLLKERMRLNESIKTECLLEDFISAFNLDEIKNKIKERKTIIEKDKQDKINKLSSKEVRIKDVEEVFEIKEIKEQLKSDHEKINLLLDIINEHPPFDNLKKLLEAIQKEKQNTVNANTNK